jgi:hypothetical protein
MHWYEFGLARSDVASWVTGSGKGKAFRLKDICDYAGRPKDSSDAELDNRMSIGLAHEVIADLLERGLIEPTVDANKVERYQPIVSTRLNQKKWKRLILPRGMLRHAMVSAWRGFKNWFWVTLLWLLTLVVGAVIKKLLFG